MKMKSGKEREALPGPASPSQDSHHKPKGLHEFSCLLPAVGGSTLSRAQDHGTEEKLKAEGQLCGSPPHRMARTLLSFEKTPQLILTGLPVRNL